MIISCFILKPTEKEFFGFVCLHCFLLFSFQLCFAYFVSLCFALFNSFAPLRSDIPFNWLEKTLQKKSVSLFTFFRRALQKTWANSRGLFDHTSAVKFGLTPAQTNLVATLPISITSVPLDHQGSASVTKTSCPGPSNTNCLGRSPCSPPSPRRRFILREAMQIFPSGNLRALIDWWAGAGVVVIAVASSSSCPNWTVSPSPVEGSLVWQRGNWI